MKKEKCKKEEISILKAITTRHVISINTKI
jgi:hypothetical protein